MKKRHPKYQLREKDSLQSISELFGVEESTWKRYHNNMCRLDEVIRTILPTHLKEIYLLPELWEKEKILNNEKKKNQYSYLKANPILLYNQNSLMFAPQNLNGRYGVTTYCNDNKVQYEISVVYKGKKSNGEFILCIDRCQLYINEQEPDLLLYEIADKMSKVFYPVYIEMNNLGEIVSIYNYQEIKKRSKDIIEKLKQYYVGEYSEKYINNFLIHCSNPNILINSLQNEIFLKLFFLPIHGAFENNFTAKRSFSWYDKYNIKHEENLNIRINPHYSRAGNLKVYVEPERKGNSDPYINAEYKLYPDDHSIAIILGEIALFNKHKELVVTKFEIVHLNAQDRILKRKIPELEKF